MSSKKSSHSAPVSQRHGAALSTPSSASATHSSNTSSSSSAAAAWVTPGTLIGSTMDYAAGEGCYVRHGSHDIHAAVVGVKSVSKKEGEGKPFLTVSSVKPPTRLPSVGDVVTARVTRINARMANVEILVLHPTITTVPVDSNAPAAVATALLSTPAQMGESCVLDESLAGTIRQRDVRAFDVDSVEIYKSFRPGDLVKAQVLSLGDARSYFLSTARNDLGVVLATSPAGSTMIPINWEQMQCPSTGAKEYRKVAKIEA